MRILLLLVTLLALGCGPREKKVTEEYAEESERLLRLGSEAVDAENYEKAEEYQTKLMDRGFVGAYELKGRLHTAKGEHELALDAVEEGLRLVGNDFIMLVQKANILSDLGRYPLAEAAYQKAREAPGASVPDINFNEALMSLRRGKNARALELLNQVLSHNGGEPYSTRTRGLKASALARLDRKKELEEFLNSQEAQEASRLGTIVAGEYLDLGDRQASLEAALCAARLDRTNKDALYLVREARGKGSPPSRGWKLLVLCRRDGQQAYASYVAVATTPEEAMEFCREVEAPELEFLELEQSEKTEAEPDIPEGVYQRSGLAFFKSED